MTVDPDQYGTTINFLYSLQKHGVKLGLNNITKLVRLLGDPHLAFRTVHIAGTNGKGSTSAAVASILQENGLRVGLFTSPHLVSFTERIRIDNQQISEMHVIETASFIRRLTASSGLNPTFFEFVTAMAFYHFAQNNIDWAVVETGMGGRLDATNIVRPEVSIITNISFDHREFLGETIADITHEKAGIIKHDTPVIISSRLPDVVAQLSRTAREQDAQIHIYDRDFSGSLMNMDPGQITFNYHGYTDRIGLIMQLSGGHQLYNGCTAVRACEVLREKGFSVSDASIERGLRNIRLDGRLEQVSEAPPIIVDGAHNPEAAEVLADSVKMLFPDKKVILVAGIMDDKDIDGILRPLVKIAVSVILTRPDSERAASPEKLAEILLKLKEPGCHFPFTTTQSVAEALEVAKSGCREDNIILVTGSFYTIGKVKELLGSPAVLPHLREQMHSKRKG